MTVEFHSNKDYAPIEPGLYGAGYALLPGEKTHLKEGATRYLAAVSSFADLQARAKACNGHWAYVQERPDAIWAAVDRVSSRPIYYRETAQGLAISSNGYDLLQPGDEIDEDAAFLYRFKGFTPGSSTLCKSIGRVPPGHCLQYSKDRAIELACYYPEGEEPLQISYADAKEELRRLLLQAAERMLQYIGSRDVILPLTAGLDSRFIAYNLAEAGLSDQVLCITYGRDDSKNPELDKARKVAERLGLKHRSLSSTGAKPVATYVDDVESLDFIDYLSGLGSSYYYQEYRPARQLKEEGLLSSSTVVLPGHKGDMVGGVDLSFHFMHQEVKEEYLAYAIYNYEPINLHFAPGDSAKLYECYLDLIRSYRAARGFQRYERFFNMESAPKYTFNSARTWRYFGAEPALLFNDNDLADFAFNLPFEYRYGKQIYNEVLRELFANKGISFADDKNMRDALRSPKAKIKQLLRPLFRPLLARRSIWYSDVIGFKDLMAPLPAIVARDARFRPATINGLSFVWNYLRAESIIKAKG